MIYISDLAVVYLHCSSKMFIRSCHLEQIFIILLLLPTYYLQGLLMLIVIPSVHSQALPFLLSVISFLFPLWLFLIFYVDWINCYGLFTFYILISATIIRNKLICLKIICYHVALWIIRLFPNQVAHLLLQPALTYWWLLSSVMNLFRIYERPVTRGIISLVPTPRITNSVVFLNIREGFALKRTKTVWFLGSESKCVL